MNDYSDLLVVEDIRGVNLYLDLVLWHWRKDDPPKALHFAQCAAQLAQTLSDTIAPHCPEAQEASR